MPPVAQITEAVEAVKSFEGSTDHTGLLIGFLFLALVVIVLAAWRGSSVVYQNVILPLATRGIKHLDEVGLTMQGLQGSNQLIADRLGTMETKMEKMSDSIDTIGNRVTHIERIVEPRRSDSHGG